MSKKDRRITLLAVLAMLALVLTACGSGTVQSTQPPEMTGPAAEQETVAVSPEEAEFPVVLAEGKIAVESLFPFSGINPDAGKQEGEDTAAIMVKNLSGEYLTSATVTASFADGGEQIFTVTELPAGASALVFSGDNQALAPETVCTGLRGEGEFAPLQWDGRIEVSVDGLTITVKNSSDEELNRINVYYRDVLDDKYFGGMTYIAAIEKLAAGETAQITAEGSVLGVIEVVRTAANDEK